MKNEETNSLAMECLIDKKIENHRLYIIVLTILAMWFVTGCFLVYVLTNISVETIEYAITEDINKTSESANNFCIKDDDNG